MTGVIEIEELAFNHCTALSELDFDELEIIGDYAFLDCNSLSSVTMPSIRRIGGSAFWRCEALADAVFGKDLDRIEIKAFDECTALRRIVIPLKDNLIIGNNAFYGCNGLSRVDTLAGGIYKAISSLHMKPWRNEMQEEIDIINLILPNIPESDVDEWARKTAGIQQWITTVLSRMEHFKTEHKMLVKEAMTLLELALWKAKLLNEADENKCNVDEVTKKAKIDVETARKEHRVTCGASIVIKNVLPFLALK